MSWGRGGGISSLSSRLALKGFILIVFMFSFQVDISTGKFIFGNRLLPTTLLITMEEAHFTYSTKPATCNLDHFMHFVKTKAENLKVVLAESPKYVGMRHDEAPRYMGDG